VKILVMNRFDTARTGQRRSRKKNRQFGSTKIIRVPIYLRLAIHNVIIPQQPRSLEVFYKFIEDLKKN
jgi:hypothetical protein